MALERQSEYYATMEELKATGEYPPGGAEEVARMILYPKFYRWMP